MQHLTMAAIICLIAQGASMFTIVQLYVIAQPPSPDLPFFYGTLMYNSPWGIRDSDVTIASDKHCKGGVPVRMRLFVMLSVDHATGQ